MANANRFAALGMTTPLAKEVADQITTGISQVAVSVLKYLNAAQIADVQARTATLDLTASLQSAINSGEKLHWPSGVYRHNTALTLLPTSPNIWTGDGQLTELRAGATMTAQVVKTGRTGGGTIAPVCIDGVSFNGNRVADTCLNIGISMRGWISNVFCQRFRTIAIIGGDDDGTDTAAFFETAIRHVHCYAGDGYAGFSSWPTHGLLLYPNATDNVVNDLVCSYMTESGVETRGGMNTFNALHAWGDTITGSHPLKHTIIVKASTIIDQMYADTNKQAGISVQTDRCVSVGLLQVYHPSDQLPGAGVFAPFEIASGFEAVDFAVGVIGLRGTNAADPAWRWLGATRPRKVAIGSVVGPYTPAANEYSAFVPKDFGVMGQSGSPAVLGLDSFASGTRAVIRLSANKGRRIEIGTDNLTESGSNAGSNLEIRSFADDGTTATVAVTYFRASDQWNFPGRIQLAASGGRVGFFGGTPIAKRTGTPADATDLATALTLVNALKAHMVAYSIVS